MHGPTMCVDVTCITTKRSIVAASDAPDRSILHFTVQLLTRSLPPALSLNHSSTMGRVPLWEILGGAFESQVRDAYTRISSAFARWSI
jgi:hypothetical protein